MPSDHAIIYTHTDEAPALATRSLLPIVNAFTGVAGVPGSEEPGSMGFEPARNSWLRSYAV